MIHLTRLNNQPLVVNADLIKFIEKSPDTVITLVTGEKLVVRESVEEVLNRIGEFHRRFLRRIVPNLPGMSSDDFGADSSNEPQKPRESK